MPRCKSVAFAPACEPLESRRLLAAGALDPTFGDGGVRRMGDGLWAATSVALQPDGKIVMGVYGGGVDAKVVRLNPDGSADKSFSRDGQAVINVAKGAEGVGSVVLLSDGKILVHGGFEADRDAFYVARLNRDGSLDSTFDRDGISIIRRNGLKLIPQKGMAVDAAGRIIVAGSVYGPPRAGDTHRQNAGLFRLLPNGRLDPSFGRKGIVTTNLGHLALAQEVAIQADGKIVATSWKERDALYKEYYPDGPPSLPRRNGPAPDPDSKVRVLDGLVALRYNPDGSLDRSFADAGKFIGRLPGALAASEEVAIAADGSIVIGANLVGSNVGRSALQKLKPDGSPDVAFGDGGDGNVILGGIFAIHQLLFQPDGKILLAGSGAGPDFRPGSGGLSGLVVRRLNSDGSPDLSYGDGGVAEVSFSSDSLGRTAVLQRDGNLVVAGSVSNRDDQGSTDLILARFEGGKGSGGSKFAPLRRGIDQQPPRKAKAKKQAPRRAATAQPARAPAPAPQVSFAAVPARSVFATERIGAESGDELLD
jgi:uncharacterized delta-60 repeat protein